MRMRRGLYINVLSHVSATQWIVAREAPLSMELYRQEHYSGLPFPCPADLPNPGIESTSLPAPAVAGGIFATEPPGKSLLYSRITPKHSRK